MLRTITADQLDEWIAYYRLEPFGVEMWDWLIAHFKALFANANRDPKKNRRGYRAGQFLCFSARRGTKISEEEANEEPGGDGDHGEYQEIEDYPGGGVNRHAQEQGSVPQDFKG